MRPASWAGNARILLTATLRTHDRGIELNTNPNYQRARRFDGPTSSRPVPKPGALSDHGRARTVSMPWHCARRTRRDRCSRCAVCALHLRALKDRRELISGRADVLCRPLIAEQLGSSDAHSHSRMAAEGSPARRARSSCSTRTPTNRARRVQARREYDPAALATLRKLCAIIATAKRTTWIRALYDQLLRPGASPRSASRTSKSSPAIARPRATPRWLRGRAAASRRSRCTCRAAPSTCASRLRLRGPARPGAGGEAGRRRATTKFRLRAHRHRAFPHLGRLMATVARLWENPA